MNQFYTLCIPAEERQRVQALEPFDEYEVTLLFPSLHQAYGSVPAAMGLHECGYSFM